MATLTLHTQGLPTHGMMAACLRDILIYSLPGMGGDLAPKLGGTKKIFRGPRFLNDVFFGKNLHFQGQNFFFFSHRPGFWDFPFFCNIFRMFTMLNVLYHPFLTRKTHFFTRFILSRASDNTTSQNIGGDQCMGRPPHLKLWGGPSPPVPPRSPPLIKTSTNY